MFGDLNLAKRLETAEGNACREYATARKARFPSSSATWIEDGGVIAVFDGAESPVTQTFGLGIFEPISVAQLERIEQFFTSRAAPVCHEVCPLAGIASLRLVCERNYRPIEISSVLYRETTLPTRTQPSAIAVRPASPSEATLWAAINNRAWSSDHPELGEFLNEVGQLSFARQSSISFFGFYEGTPAATASLSLHNDVGLLAGSATVPEMRRRGLQSALLDARIRYAIERGCDVLMMVAEAGSTSQRNAERSGFRIAYTRTKWQLSPK